MAAAFLAQNPSPFARNSGTALAASYNGLLQHYLSLPGFLLLYAASQLVQSHISAQHSAGAGPQQCAREWKQHG
jgi:hypothetical protein